MTKKKPKFDPSLPYEVAEKPKFDSSLPVETLPDPSGAEKFETGARSAIEGATFGVSEPVISGLNALIGAGIESAMDENVDFNPETIKRIYAEDIARRKQLEDQLPVIAAGSEIAGAIAPALLTGGAGALGSIGRAGTAAGRGVAEALGGGLLARAAGGAAEGALVAGAQQGLKTGVQEATGFGPQGDVGEAALSGAALGAAFPLAGKALSAIKGAPKKALSLAGGVSERSIDEYVAASKARGGPIKNISLADVKEIVDDAKGLSTELAKGRRDEFTAKAIEGVKKLKDQVIEESERAYNILGKAKGKVNKSKILDEFKKVADDISPLSEAEIAAKNKLEGWISRLGKNYDDKVDFKDVKNIIKSLDKDTSAAYSNRAGEFGSDVGNALKSVRRGLDTYLKGSVKLYNSQMARVADRVQRLERATQSFGDEASAARTLERSIIGKETPAKAQALKAIEEIDRGELTGGYLKSLQESYQANNMAANLTNTDNFVKQLVRNSGNVQKNQQILKTLSEWSEGKLENLVSDARILDRFSKDITKGSRNVNLFGILGLTTANIPGAAGGVVLGRVLDQYGPKITKSILDGMGRIPGIPTLQKIDKYFSNIPPEVKARLKSDLIRAYTIAREEGPVEVTPDAAMYIEKDLMDSGLSNIDKAKALRDISDKGQVDSGLLRKLAIGEPSNEAQSLLRGGK